MATVWDSAVTLSLVLISPVMARAHLNAYPSQPHQSTTWQPNCCLKCSRFDHVPLAWLPITLRITPGPRGLAPKALPLAFPSPLLQAPLSCCTELFLDPQHKQGLFLLTLCTPGSPAWNALAMLLQLPFQVIHSVNKIY